jgi:hypothetical protein
MNTKQCRKIVRRLNQAAADKPQQQDFYPAEFRHNGPTVTSRDRARLFKAGWVVERVPPGTETAKRLRYRCVRAPLR